MRVAIIHDWLITTRGGEKCLEVFCELFPSADLFTLIYAPDRVSSLVKSMNIRTSALNDIPRINAFIVIVCRCSHESSNRLT